MIKSAIDFFVLSALGLHCCAGFSLVVVSGGSSLVGAPASHCGGFFCYGEQALGLEGFSRCSTLAQ